MTREQDLAEAQMAYALESHPELFDAMSSMSLDGRETLTTIASYSFQARVDRLKNLPLAAPYLSNEAQSPLLHGLMRERRVWRGAEYRNRTDALGVAASKASAALLFQDHLAESSNDNL